MSDLVNYKPALSLEIDAEIHDQDQLKRHDRDQIDRELKFTVDSAAYSLLDGTQLNF